MSDTLNRILAQAADQLPRTVALSPESTAVLLFGIALLEERDQWLDTSTDPADEVTDLDWDEIERLTGNLSYEVINPMIGLVLPIVTADVPGNMLLCDGATYNRVDYPALYAVLDTVFIIDVDTFFVPDLRGRTVIGAGSGTGLTTRNVNDDGGEETHQLTEAEMPSHVHSIGIPDFSVPVAAPGEVFVPAIDFLPSFTGSAGGDVAHNNMQPFRALKYGIVVW